MEWRRVLGRNSDTRRWEYEVIGNTPTISYTASGIGFRNELRGPDRDEVHINVRVRYGSTTIKSARNEIAIDNTAPTIENRMTINPYPSWAGNTVTLIASVCDEDDPIWFDDITHRCVPPQGPYDGARRKARSYLHNIAQDGPDGGILWQAVGGGQPEGTLTQFAHAPWIATYAPPADATNGETFEIQAAIFDPGDPNDGGDTELAGVTFQVEVMGKPELEPEPEPGDFTVSVSLSATSVKLGTAITTTCEIDGEPTGEVTYEWTPADRLEDGSRDRSAPGWFNNADRAETLWQPIRPAPPEGVTLTCTATDEAGGTATPDSAPITTTFE